MRDLFRTPTDAKIWDAQVPCIKWHEVLVTYLCPAPQTVAHQTPLSMDSPGKNTGVDCHSILQETFLTQGSNLGLLHCRHILYHLSHQGVFKCGQGMGQAKRGWWHVLVFSNGLSIPGPKTICLVFCNPFLTKDKYVSHSLLWSTQSKALAWSIKQK